MPWIKPYPTMCKASSLFTVLLFQTLIVIFIYIYLTINDDEQFYIPIDHLYVMFEEEFHLSLSSFSDGLIFVIELMLFKQFRI